MKSEQSVIANHFDGYELRSFVDDDGLAWFHGTHACNILEYQNPRDVIPSNVEEEDRKKIDIGLLQPVWFVNEFGLYDLILNCKKPVAKPFKRWVTHDVLPAIRKRGGFIQDVDKYVQTSSDTEQKELQLALDKLNKLKASTGKLVEDIEWKLSKHFEHLLYGGVHSVPNNGHNYEVTNTFEDFQCDLQTYGFVYDEERIELALKLFAELKHSQTGRDNRNYELDSKTISIHSSELNEFAYCVYQSMRYDGDVNDSDTSVNMRLFEELFGVEFGAHTKNEGADDSLARHLSDIRNQLE